MNDRRPTDAQLAAALRAHLPASAQAGLRGRVTDVVGLTSQQRPRPSFLAALSDADPIARRRSLLIAAALLLGLALASATAVGAWRLLQRETNPKLDLTPPANLPAFVLSAYDRMPQMPPVAITTHTDGSAKERIYVDRSGAVRIEHYAAPDAPEPDTYTILSGTRMARLATVGPDKVWVDQDGAISEDPRVFLLAEMEGGAAYNQPGCEVAMSAGEVRNGTTASAWRYVATEYVIGRPTFHVTCGGGDLWIDVQTRLVMRSRGPVRNASFEPVPGSSRTIEVTALDFGEQPADLFAIAPPAGVARMSSEAYQCQIDPAACPSLSPPQPAYAPPLRAIQGPLPSLPPSSVRNGRIAVSANPWAFGGGENGDIYLLSAGAAPRRIIGSDDDGIAQACPTFSADGQLLAYGEARASGPVTTYHGGWQVDGRAIVVVGVNEHGDPTPALMRFAIPGGLGPMVCPEWSPTGRFLAFRVGADLWIADTASGGTRVVPIASVTGRERGELEWSRGGSRIAVAEPGQIRVVRVDGAASTLIPVDGAAPRSLGWTAGDNRIVYISVVPVDEDGNAVHVVGVDGTNDTQLSGHGPAGPGMTFSFDEAAISPDGTHVAYLQSSRQCATDSCGPGPKLPRIVVVDLYGSDRVEMSGPTLSQSPDSEFGVSDLRWSPDGQRLLLSSIDGVVSIGRGSSSSAIVYANGTNPAGLNLEWSSPEVTWQPLPS